MEQQFFAKSTTDLPQIAKKILDFTADYKKIALYGEIGAGKTTLIKSLCKELGTLDEVTSPTYALVNEYPTPKNTIMHFDLYRLKTIDEAIDINIEEYLYNEDYALIEWPELIEPLFPSKMAYIRIQVGDECRTISVTKN